MLQAQWWAVKLQLLGCCSCPQDVFSYGMVLWELLTFKTPWEALSSPWQVGAALQGSFCLHSILATLRCTTGAAHKLLA